MIDEERFKQEVQKQFPRADFTFSAPVLAAYEVCFLANSTYVNVSYATPHWVVELGGVVGGGGGSLKEATDKSIACVINGRLAIIALELIPMESRLEV